MLVPSSHTEVATKTIAKDAAKTVKPPTLAESKDKLTGLASEELRHGQGNGSSCCSDAQWAGQAGRAGIRILPLETELLFSLNVTNGLPIPSSLAESML